MHKIFKFIAYNFLVVSIVLGIFEILYAFLNKYNHNVKVSKHEYYDLVTKQEKEEPFIQDPFLGIKPNANMLIRKTMRIDGELIYNFEATIDEYHRRQTPNNRQLKIAYFFLVVPIPMVILTTRKQYLTIRLLV